MCVLPSFVENFDVKLPAYTRKINNRAHWDVEGDSMMERARKVTESLVKNVNAKIWQCSSIVKSSVLLFYLHFVKTLTLSLLILFCVLYTSVVHKKRDAPRAPKTPPKNALNPSWYPRFLLTGQALISRPHLQTSKHLE